MLNEINLFQVHLPVLLSATRSSSTSAACALAGGAAAAVGGLASLLKKLKGVRASLLVNPEDVIAGRTWLHLRWRGAMPERVARVHVACTQVGASAGENICSFPLGICSCSFGHSSSAGHLTGRVVGMRGCIRLALAKARCGVLARHFPRAIP